MKLILTNENGRSNTFILNKKSTPGEGMPGTYIDRIIPTSRLLSPCGAPFFRNI